MECLICGKLLEQRELCFHFKKYHNITARGYYDKYIKCADEGLCLNCGKKTTFYSINKGYANFCCTGCVNKYQGTKDKIRATCIDRYGENMESVLDKRNKTNLEKYGVENPFQSEEIKEKIRQTNLEKYGVENPMKNEDVKEKFNQSIKDKYGVDNISQLAIIKNKKRKIFINKYNNNYIKVKETNLEKYGVENPFQSEEIKEKIRQTNLEKYGVEYYTQTEEFKIKMKKTSRKNFFNLLLNSERLKDRVTPNFTLDDYKGVEDVYYEWVCNKCGTIFIDHIDNGHIPLCKNCYDVKTTSTYEIEIAEWLNSIGIKFYQNYRKLIHPYEIDFYLYEHNIAIEFNGLYWHNDSRKERYYHLNKTEMCELQDTQLIHIFEDEYRDKEDIIKSIILAKIGVYGNKIYGRECVVKKVNKDLCDSFLLENHIQGLCTYKYALGLYHKDILVCIAVFGRNRFAQDNSIELIRFCSKKNTQVLGGLSKLMKNACRIYKFEYIKSYCDKRFSTGVSYENSGFSLVDTTDVGYFYTDGKYRYNRMRFQKHKLSGLLSKYDEELTEGENMVLNGYNKIWDCGNYVFEFRNQQAVL